MGRNVKNVQFTDTISTRR